MTHTLCFQSQPHAQSECGDYPSSTLPLTRREKQRRSSQEPHALGAPHNLGPVHPPGYMIRRASISSPISSPEHMPHPQLIQPLHGGYMQQPLPPEAYQQQPHPHHHHHHHHGSRHGHTHKGKRVLPTTPNEEPYQHPPPESMRPHSRAESTPDPLPVPWRSNLAPHSQLVVAMPLSPTSPGPTLGSPTEDLKMYPGLKEPLVAPVTQQHRHKSGTKKKLSPLRPKSVSVGSMRVPGNLSKSIDGLNLKASVMEQPGSHTVSGLSWHQHKKIVPLRNKRNSEGTLQGWSSAQRLGQPADIQALMRSGQGLPSASFNTLPYNKHKLDLSSAAYQESGSTTSVEIRHEMFTPSPHSPLGSKGSSPQGPSPQASNTHFRSSSDNFKVDPMSAREVSAQKHRRLQHPIPPHHAKLRSLSAKQRQEPYYTENHTPEHSSSMKYVGVEQRHHTYQQHDLPNLETGKVGGKFVKGS